MPKLTLADFAGPSRQSGNQTNYQTCPTCGDNKWHMYVGENGGYCCFKCGARGYISGVPMTPGTLNEGANKSHVWQPIDPPLTAPLGPAAIAYLKGRGVDRATALALGFRQLVDSPRLFIPYLDESGDLIYWSSRAYAECAGPKYMNAHGIPTPIWCPRLNLLPHYVIVEGVFDAIAVLKAGFEPVALSGKTISKYQWPQLKALLNPEYLVRICLDGDAMQESIALSEKLTRAGYATSVTILENDKDPATTPDLVERLL